MQHYVPTEGGITHLARIIKDANDADIIVCHSGSMKALAERAHKRMCPDKLLMFMVESPCDGCYQSPCACLPDDVGCDWQIA